VLWGSLCVGVADIGGEVAGDGIGLGGLDSKPADSVSGVVARAAAVSGVIGVGGHRGDDYRASGAGRGGGGRRGGLGHTASRG
jgi:hypothetical protein